MTGGVSRLMRPSVLAARTSSVLDYPESFIVPFIAGDAFDPAFCRTYPPIYTPLDTPPPALSEVKMLTELRGHISVIHASALFHLFDEERQLALAHALAGLLAPHPGAMIFGTHSGAAEKSTQVHSPQGSGGKQITVFCHSPESWTKLWESVFEPGKVKVDARLEDITPSSPDGKEPERRWYLLSCGLSRGYERSQHEVSSTDMLRRRGTQETCISPALVNVSGKDCEHCNDNICIIRADKHPG